MLHRITLPESNNSLELTKKIQKISMNSFEVMVFLKHKTSEGHSHGIFQAENTLSVEANKIVAAVENSLASRIEN